MCSQFRSCLSSEKFHFSSSCLFEKPAVFFHLQLSSFGLVTTTAASGAPLGTGPKQLDQEFDRGSLWVTASSELHNALCITALTQLMFCVSSPRNKVYLQLFQVFCVISSQKKKKNTTGNFCQVRPKYWQSTADVFRDHYISRLRYKTLSRHSCSSRHERKCWRMRTDVPASALNSTRPEENKPGQMLRSGCAVWATFQNFANVPFFFSCATVFTYCIGTDCWSETPTATSQTHNLITFRGLIFLSAWTVMLNLRLMTWSQFYFNLISELQQLFLPTLIFNSSPLESN